MKKANFILAILGITLAVVLATGATKAMGHMMAESMDNTMDSIFELQPVPLRRRDAGKIYSYSDIKGKQKINRM